MHGLVYTLPGIAALVAAMMVGAALFARLPTRQLVFFGVLNTGIFLWAGGYFTGYVVPQLFVPEHRQLVGEGLFLLAQLGVALAPVYWFLFSAETTGAYEWTTGPRFALVHLPAVLLFGSAATNGLHHLFATRVTPSIQYGPLGLVSLAALYLLVAIGCWRYVLAARDDIGLSPRVCYALATAGVAILASNTVWTTRGLTGLELPYNPTIVLLPFVSVLIAVLVMRSSLLDVVPIAEGQAFHSMADGGIVLDASGGIVALNDAAQRMAPHLRRGRQLSEIAPALAEAVARVASGESDVPRGQHDWWVRVEPMRSPSGQQLGMLVLLTDLAEKRAFEQRIVELNRDLRRTVFELEAATRAKDRFIASASHELRTPLQSVIGYTQRLLFERVGRLTKAQRDELEIVERSSHHLLAVIESLLDIAQLESGEIAMQDKVFDPEITVRQVLDTIEPLASVKGIELKWAYDGPDEMESDETKVRQILLNLVANAVKFTETGSVTVDCEKCDGGAGVLFRVRDTGPGIPEDEIARIFEAFHRVLDGTTENAGAGLGLYVSQVLVGMLKGTIDVESAQGTGTTFTLTLPVSPAEPSAEGMSA